MMVDVTAERRFVWSVAAASVIPWCVILILNQLDHSPRGGLFALMLLAFGGAHVGTTAAFYVDPEARPLLLADRTRYIFVPLGLVLGATLIGWGGPEWLSILVIGVGYSVWSIHHFTRQNLGLFAFSCKATGRPGPTNDERRIFDLTGLAGMCGLIAAVVPSWPLVNGLVPMVGLGLLAVAGAMVIQQSDGWRRTGLGLAVLFYLPLFLYRGDLYSASLVYLLAHGAHYELMMLHLGNGRSPQDRRRMLAAVALAFLVVGVPIHMARTATSAIVAAAQNGLVAGHFVVDAGIWKARTPEQRAYMGRRFPLLRPQLRDPIGDHVGAETQDRV